MELFSARGISRLAWVSDVSDLLAVPRGDVAVSPSDLCVSSRSSSSSEKSGSNSSLRLCPNLNDILMRQALTKRKEKENSTSWRAASQSYLGQIIKDANTGGRHRSGDCNYTLRDVASGCALTIDHDPRQFKLGSICVNCHVGKNRIRPVPKQNALTALLPASEMLIVFRLLPNESLPSQIQSSRMSG